VALVVFRLRELDRDELFEKARGEILDEVASLSQVSAHEWERAFRKGMWDKMRPYVFENIYMTAAQARNPGTVHRIALFARETF